MAKGYSNEKRTCPHCGKVSWAGQIGTHIKFMHTDYNIQKFWQKVDKNGPNGCWVWTGYRQRFGHGWLGRRGLAHRHAWELLKGPLPADKCLLHKCDNPPCVNPAHLYLGDRADNARDSVSKDRHARGERNRRNKLTEAQVIEIKQKFRKEGTHQGARSNAKELAAEYGVGDGAITAIVYGRYWKHVKGANV